MGTDPYRRWRLTIFVVVSAAAVLYFGLLLLSVVLSVAESS
jgi:hypothetical protein